MTKRWLTVYSWALIGVSLTKIWLAFIGLFIILPMGLFSQSRVENPLDRFYANLVRMVFLTQVMVYALAATRLYEVISLTVLYLAVGVWRFRAVRTREDFRSLFLRMGSYVFRLVEGSANLPSPISILNSMRRKAGSMTREKTVLMDAIALLGVVGFAAYLRYWDPLTNAAPAMSDSYVTLAWMKYVGRRQLFHDGLYPQGFHIILSVLQKFSAVEGLLVLKYVGPMASTLTTLSCYYLVSRVTDSPLAGVVSAFVYGCLPSLMPYEFERQAATNSQEFAMAFLLPAVWYTVRYLAGDSEYDLAVAFSAVSVIGLTHPMVAFFVAVGVACAVSGTLLARCVKVKTLLRLAGAGFVSVVVSALPLAAGTLFGIPFHGSSAEFMTAGGTGWCPPIRPADRILLCACAVAALLGTLRAGTNTDRAGLFTVPVLAGLSLIVYQAPRFGITSLALSARAPEFYALTLSLCAGLAASLITPRGPAPCFGSSLTNRPRSPIIEWGVRICVVCLMVVGLYRHPQHPAKPYKMQTNQSAEQYLRILMTETPTDWLVVSDIEGYSLVLGKGWHLMTGDFVSGVDPRCDELRFAGDGRLVTLDVRRIYIFHERIPYRPPIEAALPQYLRKVEDQKLLGEWIARYESYHGPLQVYYRDEELTIYVIDRGFDQMDEFRRVWM